MIGTHLLHEFVLPILGVAPVDSSLHLAILMPYCENGSIVDWISDKSRFHERGRLVNPPHNYTIFLFIDISLGLGDSRRAHLPSL